MKPVICILTGFIIGYGLDSYYIYINLSFLQYHWRY